jgi:ribosomal protein S27AE
MMPAEIVQHFGKDALKQLRDVIMDRPIHEIADWVLMYQSEEDIANWLVDLRQDEIAEEEMPKYRDCPSCKQDVLMLNGTGMHWTCGTCGFRQRVEREEP